MAIVNEHQQWEKQQNHEKDDNLRHTKSDVYLLTNAVCLSICM